MIVLAHLWSRLWFVKVNELSNKFFVVLLTNTQITDTCTGARLKRLLTWHNDNDYYQEADCTS